MKEKGSGTGARSSQEGSVLCKNVLHIFSPTIHFNPPRVPVFYLRPCDIVGIQSSLLVLCQANRMKTFKTLHAGKFNY